MHRILKFMTSVLNEQRIYSPSKSIIEFWLRRLHSLLGLIPLTFFLIFHLCANSLALEGPDKFNQVVNLLRSIPHLVFVESLALGLPILFHGLYGLIISPNITRDKISSYPFVRNFTYLFQRITGVILFVFIAVHVYQLRFVEDLDFNFVAGYFRQPAWAAFYLAGILSAVYHLANGVWNFFVSWGITVGKDAQKILAYICVILCLGLMFVGVLDWWAFIKKSENINNIKTEETVQTVQKVTNCDNSLSIGKCDVITHEKQVINN